MQQFRAPILSVNKKGRSLFIFLVIAAALILLSVGILTWVFQLAGILIFIYGGAKYYLQTKKQVLKKVIGEIMIDEDTITARNEIYSIADIKAILFSVSGWQQYGRIGDKNVPMDNFHTGDNNILSFFYNGEEKKFDILLSSKEQWELLRQHVISWYKKGIKVIENDHSTKTYGLELLNYSQVQEFKKIITTHNSQTE